MTDATVPAQSGRAGAGFDLSGVILVAFALVLCVLIVLPLSWLVYYSVIDRNGAFTLDNFAQLVTDPTFLDLHWHGGVIELGAIGARHERNRAPQVR